MGTAPSASVGQLRRARVGGLLAKVALVCAATIIAMVVCEIGLRVFMNVPHPYTTHGRPGDDYVYDELRRQPINKYVPSRHTQHSRVLTPDPNVAHGLSPKVRYTIDQFGFRGSHSISLEKPRGVFRIIAVGGSTTECRLQDDETTWPELVAQTLAIQHPGAEMINAGYSGDTTRDHINLLSQRLVPFEPDVVLFLVGINDLDLQMKPDYSILRQDRRSLIQEATISTGLLLKVWISDWSHLARLAVIARRNRLTEDERGNPIQDATAQWIQMKREQRQRLPVREVDTSRWPTAEYGQNLRTLVGICRANGAVPVLITQPAIWGAPAGPWEESLWVHPDRHYRVSPDQLWVILESFNEVTRQLAADMDVALIDLARSLPKTPEVFWDDDHFTDAGCRMVAEIIAGELEKLNLIET